MRDRTPIKVLFSRKNRSTMGNSPVDRDKEYMYKMWGTKDLITDYWTMPKESNDCAEENGDLCIQEVFRDSAKKIDNES
jgi:hypothetical protein|tara:strand:+ start:12 stop:248 length:237 start_codon:yes stop_codon:yes gene_type:complete